MHVESSELRAASSDDAPGDEDPNDTGDASVAENAHEAGLVEPPPMERTLHPRASPLRTLEHHSGILQRCRTLKQVLKS